MSDADRRSLRAARTLSPQRRFQGACSFYFTDYTLTGQPDGFASESQDCEWGRGVLLVKPSHGASQLFFTDYTLTGQPDAFASESQGCDRGGPGASSW